MGDNVLSSHSFNIWPIHIATLRRASVSVQSARLRIGRLQARNTLAETQDPCGFWPTLVD